MNGPCPLGSYSTNFKICCLATAVYGNNAKELEPLHYLRDNKLAPKKLGRALIDMYYRISPSLAKIVNMTDKFKAITKKILTLPVKHYQSMV